MTETSRNIRRRPDAATLRAGRRERLATRGLEPDRGRAIGPPGGVAARRAEAYAAQGAGACGPLADARELGAQREDHRRGGDGSARSTRGDGSSGGARHAARAASRGGGEGRRRAACGGGSPAPAAGRAAAGTSATARKSAARRVLARLRASARRRPSRAAVARRPRRRRRSAGTSSSSGRGAAVLKKRESDVAATGERGRERAARAARTQRADPERLCSPRAPAAAPAAQRRRAAIASRAATRRAVPRVACPAARAYLAALRADGAPRPDGGFRRRGAVGGGRR